MILSHCQICNGIKKPKAGKHFRFQNRLIIKIYPSYNLSQYNRMNISREMFLLFIKKFIILMMNNLYKQSKELPCIMKFSFDIFSKYYNRRDQRQSIKTYTLNIISGRHFNTKCVK